MPLKLFDDYVVNSGADDDNAGWLAGFGVGKCKDPGSAQFTCNYRMLEKDAVVGAFCDSDSFGGGTNGKGHTVSVAYQLNKASTVGFTYFLDKKNLDSPIDYKRCQVDLLVKF